MTALLVAALTASAHAIGRGSEGACCTCHAVALAGDLDPMAQPQRHRSCSGCDGRALPERPHVTVSPSPPATRVLLARAVCTACTTCRKELMT